MTQTPLPGAPVLTRTGLASSRRSPAGRTQLSRRTMTTIYHMYSYLCWRCTVH